MIRKALPRTAPALVLLLGMLWTPWGAAEVVQAYPAVYELSRTSDGETRVLAGGDVLIKENRTVEVSDAARDDDGAAITLGFTVEPDHETERRLAVGVTAEIAYEEGERRLSASEDDNGNFIAGPDVRRVTFETRRWQTMDDPEPMRIEHEENDATYVLTLMFEPGAFR